MINVAIRLDTAFQSAFQNTCRAYDEWRLRTLTARLEVLPEDCERSREAAHEKYVDALRYIDKREKVDRIELEHQIDELKRRLA